jgi:anti-sigma factor RsiW
MSDGSHPDRLPWLVAGRLEPLESRQVAEHLRSCAACRAAAEALASMRRSLDAVHGAGHVTSEDLVAFTEHDAALPPARRRAIAAHLGDCGECAEDERLLRRVAAPGGAGARPPARFLWRQWGVAAVLAGMVVGLGAFLVARRMPAMPGTGPTPGVTLFASPRRAPRPDLTLAPGPARPITVLLPLDAHPGTYRMRLERPDGVVSEGARWDADENGVLTATLPAIAAPGTYRLVLRQNVPEVREYAYEFRVAAPGPAPSAPPP